MCGIVGFWDKKNRLTDAQKQSLINQMVETFDHRGRDDSGFYVRGQLAVGHTRLSILDLTKNGAQPFFDDQKNLVLSYNGEIYNYRDLNKSLSPRHKLKSSCDTETILVGYQDEGKTFIPKLNGMFAFSIHDATRNIITLAVDRFAIKPLYVINTSDWFAWSSEIKSLLLLPGFKAEVNQKALLENLVFKQIYGGQTLFNNIQRLMPAQIMEFDTNSFGVSKEIYWRLEKKAFDIADLQDALEKQLSKSVSEHLLADVPVGVQLSGGVDSSLVAALATQYKSGLTTYSIGLKEEGWNEFEYSRAVAKKYNTNHHELTFTEDDFCRALPKLTYYHDEPIGHSHSVPMFLLAEAARKDVKVLLSGEGADEVFFGYKRYRSMFKDVSKQKDILFSNAFVDKNIATSLLTDSVASPLEFNARQNLVLENANLSWVEQISLYDLQTYLPPLLLRQDKMGMAANLENRVPFLDYKLVEFGYSLPEEYKIDANENKILLKKIATKYLPTDIIYRPKVGFGQPLAAWFKNPSGLGRYLKFFDAGQERRSYLNYDFIRQLIADHQNNTANHSEILWILINLEIWARIFIDDNKPETIY